VTRAAVRSGMLLVLALLCASGPAHADFAAAISPPRYELEGAAGQTQRNVLEIAQASAQPGHYRIYTADWTMTASGDLTFDETLASDSCRPWVALERREVTIAAATKLRYRFEVTPPADAPKGECRFALMIESAEPSSVAGAASFPMSGRIGVIVYVRVGGVQPELRIDGGLTARIDGRDVPALRVTNVGGATGRLVGFVTARDATDHFVDLAPDAIPILPGMTRVVGLMPVPPLDRPNDAPPRIEAWPIAVKGQLEIGGLPGSRISLERRFLAP
jgi:hypothetical protein